MNNSNDRLLDILDIVLKVVVAIFVAVAVISVGALLVNQGYKDGYCSALGGSTIGDARVCNVDGRVVEIPKP